MHHTTSGIVNHQGVFCPLRGMMSGPGFTQRHGVGLEEVRAAFLSSGLWIDAQRSMEGVQGADLKPASCPNISPLPDINCAIIEAVAVPQYHTDPALAPVPGGVGGAADWCSASPQSRTLGQNALLLRPLGGGP